MDARGPTAAHVLRKTIVARMAELSVSGFRELVSGGCGGLLLLLPPGLGQGVGAEAREVILALEEELLTAELDIPIYFAQVMVVVMLELRMMQIPMGRENEYQQLWQLFKSVYEMIHV